MLLAPFIGGASGRYGRRAFAVLQPFIDRFGHKKRGVMCPLYIAGLLGPGDRKSIEPMAARLAPGQYDRLHHFISDGMWDDEPLMLELARQADRMVGADDAFLVIDDTALPKKGSIPSGSPRNMLRCWAREPIARRWYR